jgi:FMN phosphatase YigB (HAD superfamily)
MSASPAPVLVLDLGRVCIELDESRICKALACDSVDTLLAEKPWLAELVHEVETGEMAEDIFLQTLAARLSGEWTPGDVLDVWNSRLGAEISGMAEVVAFALERNLRCVALSDISPMHAAHIPSLLSFWSSFDAVVYSYEVGELKPGPKMYQAVEQRFCEGGIPLLYADDKQVNIEAARSRGWAAYHFGNAPELLETLKALA